MAVYEVTAPDGSVFEIEGPEGADPSQIIAQIQGQAGSSAQPGPSFLQQAGRQAALGGRAVIEGIAQLAALPSDALFGTINAIYQMRGEQPPFQLASESIRQGLTDAGLPQAETGAEKLATGVVGALSGTGGTMLAGRALATPLAGMVERGVGEVLAARPGSQAAGAVASTAASQGAAALGAPAPVQIAAGMAAGTATGLPGGAVGRAGRGAVQPLTEKGRRVIAGQALRSAAHDPDAAMQALSREGAELVPGSAPTTAQVSKDPGLAYFETRLRALGDPRFQQRASAQNAARQALLDSVADGGLPERVAARVRRREQITQPLRDQAFKQAAGQRVPVEKVIADIDALLADPENAGRSVQQALKEIRGQLVKEVGRETQPDGTVVQQVEALTDARALYAIRKEINRILEGRYVGADESVLRYAGGQLSKVRDSIDDAISEVAPSWKQYLTKYAQLSRPIERAETIRDIRQRTALAAPDIATGRDFISQPKWRQVVDRAMPDLQKTMTKGQLQKLNRITADLDRGAAVAAAGKLPGSDTAANLAMSGQISVANIIGRVLGRSPQDLPPGLATFARPLAFVYRLPDEAVRQLLVEAMLDPKLADQLLKEGSAQNVRRFALELSERARGATAGAATGTAAQGVAQ